MVKKKKKTIKKTKKTAKKIAKKAKPSVKKSAAKNTRAKQAAAKKSPKKPLKIQPNLNWTEHSIQEAVATIIQFLRAQNVEAVLVGSACAAIYVPCLSARCIELVVYEYHVEVMKKLMRRLKFRPTELRLFKSKHAPFDVVFLPPPLEVGDAAVSEIAEFSNDLCSINLLNHTDCVRHRLAQWYHWGEQSALDQAVVVSKCHPKQVNQALIKRWSAHEWASEKYQQYLDLLSKA